MKILRIITAATAISILFGMFFGVSYIMGRSMEPNVHEGDLALFFRGVREYRKDDVVIINRDSDRDFAIKRIVGVPGDTIDIKSDTKELIINGERQQQSEYLEIAYAKEEGITYPLTLGENEYFVIGDNRPVSWDSRNYGRVTVDEIVGRTIVVVHNNFGGLSW